ncbi:unnamed protein product [Hermetia illucens]|uniref:Antifreeze protein n=1 Tax=Hermetia illucens TaxID=343691 RepID=A0A7R8YT78_HERIL|nr:unnamed protein product [Hermetia illucens]
MRLILVFVCTIACFVRISYSQCGVCLSTSQAACISETEFQLCFDGVASGDTYTCPTDTICTEDVAICTSGDWFSDAAVCTPQCGKCDRNNRVACLNETSFAFCFGETTPSTTIGSCPDGLVCSNSATSFCVDPSQTAPDCIADVPSTASGPCSGPGKFPLLGTNCTQCTFIVIITIMSFGIKTILVKVLQSSTP